jgi:hypothetical protein
LLGFNAFVLFLLAIDLGIFHRQAHEVSMREAAIWSAIWIGLSLSFNVGVYAFINTSDMAHKIPRCIEWVTSIHTLEPGDILATGTNHRGLSGFQDGDRIELETEGLGTLHFNVRDDLKRTWSRETRLDRQEKGQEGTTPQLTGKHKK